MRHLRLGLAFYAQYLKGLLAFRWDFLLNVTGTLIGQFLNIAMLTAIFSRIPHLQGWRFEQVLFIYGFAQLPLNLFYMFGSSLTGINHLILDGHLDQILVRPVNPLVQVLAREFGYQQISAVLTSLGLIAYATVKLTLPLAWWHPLAFLAFVLGGVAIYLGMALLAGSASFWFMERSGLVWPLLSVADFAQYPVTIYSRPIRLLVTWVLPFAFTAFYPATLFLGVQTYAVYAWLTPVIGLITFGAGYALWLRGLKAYTSTGS